MEIPESGWLFIALLTRGSRQAGDTRDAVAVVCVASVSCNRITSESDSPQPSASEAQTEAYLIMLMTYKYRAAPQCLDLEMKA